MIKGMNFKELNLIMLNDYISVNSKTNPFSRELSELSNGQVGKVLGQYSLFPRNIVSCFVEAVYSLSYYDWDDISDELVHNISEELGKTEEGKPIKKGEENKFLAQPHYTILREGLKKGLDFDIKLVKGSLYTNSFLKELKACMSISNPAQIAGSVYALESSAVPELYIVYALANKMFELEGKTMPIELNEFFKFHIEEIEIEHRDRLEENCNKYLKTEQEFSDFEFGFKKVLILMDIWWNELYKDICLNETQE